MTDKFDPHLTWLGIRTGGKKANHYRLLGLELFEADNAVIANAADRQIGHVGSFASDYPAESDQVINELKAARNCLLSVENKKVYDHRLRQAIERRRQQRQPGKQPAAPPATAPSESRPQPTAPQGQGQGQAAGAPDFANIGDPSSGFSAGQSVAPQIKSSTRKSRSGGSWDWVGWVAGALGAVGFAYVLLNTDLIERIKGGGTKFDPNATVVVNSDQQPTEPAQAATAANTASTRRPTTTTRRPSTSANPSNTNATDNSSTTDFDPNLSQTTTQGSDSSAELPEQQFTPPPRSAPTPQPTPEAELVKKAKLQIAKEYATQISGDDKNLKSVVAKQLISSAADKAESHIRYAQLVFGAELAGEAGNVAELIKAANKFKTHFIGDEFWEHVAQPLKRVFVAGKSMDELRLNLRDLLELAEENSQWEMCVDIAEGAGRLAKREHDMTQQDMLKRYSRDLKGLMSLEKKYVLLADKEPSDLNAKEKLTYGKYLCYAKNDWAGGLDLLADGSDVALGAVAKLDVDAKNQPDVAFSIAKSWAELGMKQKYKGTDRRFFLMRARDLLDHSNQSYSENAEAENSITRQISVFKEYIPIGLTQEPVNFKVTGWATFDRAVMSRTSLVLYLNNKSKTLRLIAKDQGDYYAGKTTDNQIRFEIRKLQSDVFEMKIFETSNDRLRNIIYGEGK